MKDASILVENCDMWLAQIEQLVDNDAIWYNFRRINAKGMDRYGMSESIQFY